MASSSSFIPAYVSQSWNHDVFLSFRGEDTRKGFVDHLYTALVQRGIHTYKDDETLARGESIGLALRKAIQESRIAIIVFSKNYADSSWCLDELAYIIECMENKGQIVIPVFYDIDPSDVRKQNGKYEEAFTKHEWENNKHKVESWRKAMIKAGNLSGWVPKDFANGHEAKCIKDIVEKISVRLPQLIPNVNKYLFGIETRLLDLNSKLKIGSGGVHMVGIWGVGGGGKTTLAFAAYTEISHQFEAHCLLENIRDESSKHGLKRLQENLLSFILKTKVEIESEIEGKNMIKRKLGHKTVLVVLDDIDNLKQLEALVGSHDWFGEGSRVIITTRDKHLLTRHADMIYEVNLLSHDEAIKLFNRRAYRKDKPTRDYEFLSQDVVSYAGGLPFALEIIGSFLYDKDKDEWKCALAKLKCIPDVQVMERLKISYDGLKSDEKELFLDIACFMRRWEIDDAMRVLDACSFHPGIGVKMLVQKSLIKVSNGIFDMHDLIEEMARYIVREEHPINPEKHSRIWKDEDIVDICDMGTVAPLMETEVLALPISYDNHPRLPRVVANMKKLRLVMLVHYPASSFSSNFQPTKLGCMMLMDSGQKQLWKGCKRLPNLKVLYLYRARCLINTPDFRGLPCLERLILEDCDELKEIHPSIGYHERLVYVKMSSCLELKTFPPIIWMKKLEALKISRCRRLKKFPDIQTNMDSLVNLHLDVTDVEIIPSSVGQFCTNLVSIKFIICKLKRIEGNFHLLTSLKELDLSWCSQHLSQHKTSFKNLMNCTRLQCLDQDSLVRLKFPQFPRFLRKLNLSRCNLGDGDIPSDICEFRNLQVLCLNGNNFSRLHSRLSRIPCLKFLNLSFCKSLVELPDLPSSIAILKATQCDSLESVGDLLNYKWLWKVSLWRRKNKLIGGERLLHSMLQVNAVEDRFMSVDIPGDRSLMFYNTRTLQLPDNWYNDFSGFLLCVDRCRISECSIVIKQEALSKNYHYEEFDKNYESYEYEHVGYIPFASLRHIPWWNSTSTNITFQIHAKGDPKVELVPWKSKLTGSIERENAEIWEENQKTFEIVYDSKSCNIQIVWDHGCD